MALQTNGRSTVIRSLKTGALLQKKTKIACQLIDMGLRPNYVQSGWYDEPESMKISSIHLHYSLVLSNLHPVIGTQTQGLLVAPCIRLSHYFMAFPPCSRLLHLYSYGNSSG